MIEGERKAEIQLNDGVLEIIEELQAKIDEVKKFILFTIYYS